MIIGLHDAELEHMKNKTFPNLALMKISAYYKKLRYTVEWWEAIKQYDIVYSSKVFNFSYKNNYLPDNTEKGGTGYNIQKVLDKHIDDIYPDYTIYPNCDYALGFITRGCVRNCEWCVVPEKEGKITEYRKWQDITRSDTDKLVIMDNNILASSYGISQLESLIDSKIKIDINQGMDIRLVNKDIAYLLKNLHWMRYIRFSCDSISQLDYFEKVFSLFNQLRIPMSKIFVYLLVRKDLEDADLRVQTLNKLSKNINIYAQAERDVKENTTVDSKQLAFANRYIYSRVYKKETWNKYLKRKTENKQRL